jgi:ABC-2 type transport system ATP-binding protein
VSRKERKERMERLLRFANLEPFGRRRAQDLSGGMKQKLGLICALIHTPQILFLDEPTTGVDPLSRRDFWIILYNLLKEGVTILFSTSYLDEAERCSRVGLIHRGELLIADEPSTIKAGIDGAILELRTESHQQAMRLLEGAEPIRSLVVAGDKMHVLVDDPERGEEVIREILGKEGMEIIDLLAVRPSLEDAFVSIVRKRETINNDGSTSSP